MQIIGRCSRCGGVVIRPPDVSNWRAVCLTCGAAEKAVPVVEMIEPQRNKAAEAAQRN